MSEAVARVTRISIAPVKGLALIHPDEVLVGERGVAENRRFYVIDEIGRRYGLTRDASLVQVRAAYDADTDWLQLRFPGGKVVEERVVRGERVEADFFGRPVEGEVVQGAFGEALSSFAGRPLRLVWASRPGDGVDRECGEVSLMSRGSLEELARRSRADGVDGRRFRMLFEVDGVEPHAEDAWIGVDLRVGEAVIRLRGRVARCAITTQNPDTGRVDFDTLREIKAYRCGGVDGGQIDFGVFGGVVAPGRVRIGDVVALC
jgi:uncharacterized protein YcbX